MRDERGVKIRLSGAPTGRVGFVQRLNAGGASGGAFNLKEIEDESVSRAHAGSQQQGGNRKNDAGEEDRYEEIKGTSEGREGYGAEERSSNGADGVPGSEHGALLKSKVERSRVNGVLKEYELWWHFC